MRVVTYNPDHYNPHGFGKKSYQYEDTDVENRFLLVEEIIRQLDPDILFVQELFGRSSQEIAATTRHLAATTGLQCELGGTVTAAKSQHHNLGTGILWSSRVQPVSWLVTRKFWHPFRVLVVDVGGTRVNHACYHGQPVGKCEEAGDLRVQESLAIAEIARHNPLTIIGGDWNGLSAARQRGAHRYYDPSFDPRILHAAGMTSKEASFVLNRAPGEALEAGGLIDVAPSIFETYASELCTTGHRPTREGPQRLDRFYTTHMMLPTIHELNVVWNEMTLIASDHVPVVVTYDLT